MKYIVIYFLLMFAIPGAGAQCDCTIPPPYSKKCADTCIGLILRKAPASELASYLNIPERIAGKIVQGRSEHYYESIEDVKAVLTKKEYQVFLQGTGRLYE